MIGDDQYQVIKEIQLDVKQVLIDQATMKEDLRHHIRRTDKLEESIVPVIKHVGHVEGVVHFLKLVALIATIAGAFYATKTLF